MGRLEGQMGHLRLKWANLRFCSIHHRQHLKTFFGTARAAVYGKSITSKLSELEAVMWKRKRMLEAEAPEATIVHRSESGSCKCEMNGSGSESSKNVLEAEAEAEAAT